MKWYKHSTGSHDDPDISDAWDELGDFGYVGFFVVLEIYGEEFSHKNSEDFIRISTTFLRRKLRKSLGKVKLLLNFYEKRNRILSKFEDGFVYIKVPKFIELASNWSKRTPTETPTSLPTAKEGEVEEEVEVDIKEKSVKENPPKKKFLDSVYMTDIEHDKLYAKYSKSVVDDYMTRLNLYIQGKGKRYKSHYAVILSWMHKDGVKERTTWNLL